jgi:hypothetical protein
VICALLGYYAPSCGICLPTFRATNYHIQGSVTLEDGTETSVHNYHTTPRNIPEERRSHQHHGGSLKARSPLGSPAVGVATGVFCTLPQRMMEQSRNCVSVPRALLVRAGCATVG